MCRQTLVSVADIVPQPGARSRWHWAKQTPWLRYFESNHEAVWPDVYVAMNFIFWFVFLKLREFARAAIWIAASFSHAETSCNSILPISETLDLGPNCSRRISHIMFNFYSHKVSFWNKLEFITVDFSVETQIYSLKCNLTNLSNSI